MKKNLILILSLVWFTSCANKKSENTVVDSSFEESISVGDESGAFLEQADVAQSNSSGAQDSSKAQETEEVKDSTLIVPADQITSDGMIVGKKELEEKNVVITDKIEEFAVENGDSLMWVAFKIYGDYSKWKILKELNPNITKKRLSSGSTVKYYVPAEKFIWSPKGLPHLIKAKDTLGSISKEKYGTGKKWKLILDNNRPMIKNPNLIFAGFTLYYLKDERDLASQ